MALLDRRGPSSETYGILGRVYKDRWEAASKRGDDFEAHSLLNKAIPPYLRGFEADWRDAYPGVNAVVLMTLRHPPDSRRDQILSVVSYAAERRIATGKPDYRDYATRLELAVLAKDEERAMEALEEENQTDPRHGRFCRGHPGPQLHHLTPRGPRASPAWAARR